MATSKSEPAESLDNLQGRLRPTLKDWGFRVRGRAFNRGTADGLTEVIQLQMGSFDPPGTTHIPGLRENLYGKFTVNLGVFVPEVAEHLGSGRSKSLIHVASCSVRARLGQLGPEQRDVWWDVCDTETKADEFIGRLTRDALPFLGNFESRDRILAQWLTVPKSPFALHPTRIVCAIILTKRGQKDDARTLLVEQAKETTNPGHPEYVRRLADKLGLGDLAC